MTQSLQGRLLVATPDLSDPNFALTVVLLLDHSDEGAVGVVLNRPSDLEVAEALPDWAHLVGEPPVLFVGGPVRPNAVIGLAAHDGPLPAGWQPVLPGIGVIDLGEQEPVDVDATLRVFAGYAGWSAEQLEGEIEEGAWFVVDAEPGDALTDEPESLWEDVLRRQGGRLAMFALCPADPSQN